MALESFAFYVSLLRKDFTAYCFERFQELGITRGQLFVLLCIHKKEECSPKEISAFLHLDAGQLNRILTKLLETGFIYQRKNEKDRRANIVCLTEKGKKLVEESRSLFYEWDAKVLSSLEEGSRQNLMEAMKKISMDLHREMEDKNE